jgi:hypothetical protein
MVLVCGASTGEDEGRPGVPVPGYADEACLEGVDWDWVQEGVDRAWVQEG